MPIEVIVFGIVMEVNISHPVKTVLPRVATFGIVAETKFLHPLNALVPIVITEEGRSMEAKLVHPWKV